MNFNEHYNLQGKHAFLSASNSHWVNYTPEKLVQVYNNQLNKEEGTILHAFAQMAIERKIKVAPLKKALNAFINDAIGFNMQPEQVLYYSDNCFGTSDAIMFKDGVLRIHDLKTGHTKVYFNQLDVYVALFCLEYNIDPYKISIVERIYQGNGFTENIPNPDDILTVMKRIQEFDVILDRIKLNM